MSEEKSDKKKVVGASAKSDHSSEEETVDLRDDSHIDIKPSDDSLRCSQRDLEKDDIGLLGMLTDTEINLSLQWKIIRYSRVP